MKAVVLITACCLGQTSPYEGAQANAMRSGRPLVVGVGCVPPAGPWVSSVVGGLKGIEGPAILIGIPGRRAVVPTATLPPEATRAEIEAVINPPVRMRGRLKWNVADVPNYQERMNRSP